MDITRLRTGFAGLDTRLEGGIPKGAVVSLLGKTEVPKQKIGLSFIEQGIKHGEKCLVISTNQHITQVKQIAMKHNLSLQSVLFLDAANWRIKRVNPKLESNADYEVSNLTDLNSLLSLIMQAHKDHPELSRIFFDTPSSLLLYSTPGSEQVFKFFELLTAFTRSNGITLYYSLEKEVHSDHIVSTMLFLSDGCINLLRNGDADLAEIRFMYLTNYPKGKIKLTK